MKLITFTLIITLIFGACTANDRAKNFGGTLTKKLPANRKLVNVTWKEANLWIVTKPMLPTDIAEKYEFKEDASLGVLEGTIIIEEVKQ